MCAVCGWVMKCGRVYGVWALFRNQVSGLSSFFKGLSSLTSSTVHVCACMCLMVGVSVMYTVVLSQKGNTMPYNLITCLWTA